MTAKGTVDFYVYFFEKGIRLLRPNGVLTFITPNKYLSANYGKALRNYLYNNTRLRHLVDVSRNNIFDASIYPIIIFLTKESRRNDYYFTACDKNNIVRTFPSSQLVTLPDLIWGFVLSSNYGLTRKMITQCEPLTRICRINATSTASEADDFHSYITETSGLRLINTGTIDPFVSLWGIESLVDKGCKYLRPYLPNDKEILGDNRYRMYNNPKIIVSKMSLTLEGFLDKEGEYASINTNCFHTIQIRPEILLGWVHSKAFHYMYECFFEGLKMSGGYLPFTAPYLSCMFIPLGINRNDKLYNIVNKIIAGNLDLLSELDKECYKSLSLTYDEVLIIDPNPPFTREDYQGFEQPKN